MKLPICVGSIIKISWILNPNPNSCRFNSHFCWLNPNFQQVNSMFFILTCHSGAGTVAECTGSGSVAGIRWVPWVALWLCPIYIYVYIYIYVLCICIHAYIFIYTKKKHISICRDNNRSTAHCWIPWKMARGQTFNTAYIGGKNIWYNPLILVTCPTAEDQVLLRLPEAGWEPDRWAKDK